MDRGHRHIVSAKSGLVLLLFLFFFLPSITIFIHICMYSMLLIPLLAPVVMYGGALFLCLGRGGELL